MILIDDKHNYTNPDGVSFISVSKLKEMIKEPFEAEKIAYRKEIETGIPAQVWLNTWDKTRDEACEKGHKYHEWKEKSSLARGFEVHRGRAYWYKNPYFTFDSARYWPLNKLDGEFYPELKIWNDFYRVAGTVDRLFIERLDKPYIDIEDYKTNTKLTTTGYYNPRTKRYKTYLPPVSHLQDCKHNDHAIQLSLYAYILETWGYTPRRLSYLHEPEGNIHAKPEVVNLPYLRKEAIAILNYYKRYGYER